MKNLLQLVENTLEEIVHTYPKGKLQEAVAYSLLNAGKRLRPLLVLLALKDLQIDYTKGIYPACAIEMIHTYSLIHDDLPAMDNDSLRRGKPTNHLVFGEAMAILAADALLTDSFMYFVKSPIRADQKVEIVEWVSKNAGGKGMVYGQALDMQYTGSSVSSDQVEVIHQHKTSDLIHLSLKIAAIIADFKIEEHQIVDRIGFTLGMGFQLKDDISDVELSTERLGKDAQSDLKNDKATYVKAVGLQQAKRKLVDYRDQSLELITTVFGQKDLYALVERIL